MNFITGLKTLIVGILTSVSTAVSPVTPFFPAQSPAPKPTIISQTVQNPYPSPIPTNNPIPTSTPLPLNQNDNINIQGTYSYLGQSIKYSLSVPKNGGQFKGKIDGACQAEVSGNYSKENSGAISGQALGTCHIVFVKYQGSINFTGHLIPEGKKLVIQLQNAHLGPITLNYN